MAERDPAASFFQPQSIVQQQNNNDGNSYGIVDSAYVEGATKDNANHDGDGENNDMNNSTTVVNIMKMKTRLSLLTLTLTRQVLTSHIVISLPF